MQIYFTTTIRSARTGKKTFNKLLDHLKKRHAVKIRSKFLEEDQILEKDLPMELFPHDQIEDPKIIQSVYTNNQKKIQSSDVVICEFSNTSSGLGYDFAQAIMFNKPVLVLADKKVVLSETITGNKSNKIKVAYYDDSNICEVVDEFLEQARKMLDSKFIFIIPPKLDSYLSWANKRKGIPKADIVRHAVEAFMESDETYKEYMKEMKG
jgi:hypothetical protein